ncbi:MAG: tetratricopeptide repeat protein [Bacillota bacterium]
MSLQDLGERIDQAVEYKRRGKYQKSLNIYEKLSQDYPNEPAVYKSFGKVLAICEDYEKAKECFAIAAELFKNRGAHGQQKICKNHFVVLTNVDKNSDEFSEYINGLKGKKSRSSNTSSNKMQGGSGTGCLVVLVGVILISTMLI